MQGLGQQTGDWKETCHCFTVIVTVSTAVSDGFCQIAKPRFSWDFSHSSSFLKCADSGFCGPVRLLKDSTLMEGSVSEALMLGFLVAFPYSRCRSYPAVAPERI